MCLIAFAFTPGNDRQLVLAANRDEFHDRPARAMAWWRWPEGPLAGRDELAGGTWLAVARDGRWAAVTNFRDPRADTGARSRGDLPVGFFSEGLSPSDYARDVYHDRSAFGPFNLLAGDRRSLWYCSTWSPPEAVAPGVHALSNGLLDEGWPKSRRVSLALQRLIDRPGAADTRRLFELMDDRQTAADEELPDTGVGLEIERMLSAPFIVSPNYGTRCSTVLELGVINRATERRFSPDGQPIGELSYEFSR